MNNKLIKEKKLKSFNESVLPKLSSEFKVLPFMNGKMFKIVHPVSCFVLDYYPCASKVCIKKGHRIKWKELPLERFIDVCNQMIKYKKK